MSRVFNNVACERRFATSLERAASIVILVNVSAARNHGLSPGQPQAGHARYYSRPMLTARP